MAKNKTAAKGKGSTGRRVEKRAKKFASGGSASAAKANILRQDEDLGDDEAPKRKRAPASAAPPAKRLKQGSFARPAAAAGPKAHAAAPPLLKKAALNERVAVKMAVRKPNAALFQTTVAELASGQVPNLAASHKASRALQSVLKWGTPAQKAALQAEAAPSFGPLAKDKYGTHFLRKLIDAAEAPQLAALGRAVKGGVPALCRHPNAAPCVDALYCRLPPGGRAAMLAEFYGPQYALARVAARSQTAVPGNVAAPAPVALLRLSDVVRQAPAATRGAALQKLALTLAPILEKGLVSSSLIHRVLAEYLPLAGPGGRADAAASVAGPALLRMIHTSDGAKAAAFLLGAASARERKACLKAAKGRVTAVARDAHGHVAIMAALACVDDTALLRKSILEELFPELGELITHPAGRRVLLSLLHPRCPRYTPPDVLEALPDPVPSGGAAAEEEEADDADSDSEHGVGEGVPGVAGGSKKPAGVRRAQLLAHLAPRLAAALTLDAPAILAHPLGCDVLLEAARGGEGGAFAAAAGPEAMAALVVAVAAAAAAPETRSAFHACRTLRRLLLLPEAAQGQPSLARALWDGALSAAPGQWLEGCAGKVLAAAVLSLDASVAKEAAKAVAPLVKPETPAAWAARLGGAKEEAEGQEEPMAGTRPKRARK